MCTWSCTLSFSVYVYVGGTGRGYAKQEKSEAGVGVYKPWKREKEGNYSEGKEPCKWMLSSAESGYAK